MFAKIHKDTFFKLKSRSFCSNVKSFEEIPTLSYHDIIRLINPYNENKLRSILVELFSKHGSIIRVRVPGSHHDNVHICEPSDVQVLLQNDGPHPVNQAFSFFVSYRKRSHEAVYRGSKGLVGSHGPEWHQVRSLVQQDMLRPESALFYTPSIDQISQDMTDLIHSARGEDNRVEGVLDYVFRWALESITSIFLDRRLGCLDPDLGEESKRLIASANTLLGPDMFKLMFSSPLWKYLNLPYFKRVDRASTEILHICSKYIEESRRRLEVEPDTRQGERSVLVKLLERCGDNTAVPIVMAVDAMFAGVDTTGVTATFLLYMLATNQEKQEILYQEIKEVVGGGQVTAGGLRKMKYLRACSQESQRLLPVASGLARKTERAVTLSGHLVPPGTPVSHWAFVRTSQASHFSQPDTFLPERWLRENQQHRTAHPFSHLPFGHGPRSCIGRRFAELEISILLIKILQRFTLEYDGPPVGLKLSFTNKPDRAVNIKFRDRN